MSFSISDRCVNCYACLDLCPSNAISQGVSQFHIDSLRCTECAGHFADPQCASICPVEGALLDGEGQALHPPGSLTGIPPTLRVVAMEGQPAASLLP
ncbi:4Fe-4S binding protein [Aestuariirhabdus litorea]|uniref:Ferredoxin n=1 Tax=Aestuariirhabdus litorea TaxID=2528527 RepID=A0A3P3VML8_9GAMM|nr:4Fe-4S binding protein [Aestuariirhabdus litorea]RRJ82896.1 ferredoxin [Aestuariirhabdus litorea]RWW93055.1 ferredoxin [Endozoicomonadaceae bacterium GTF-13]